jgi:putative flippase GtrA
VTRDRTAGDLGPSGVSVVVPTRNEADNIAPLVQRLQAALDGTPAEVIFVDDSDDDTPARVCACEDTASLTVRLVHRERGERSGGLGGAVVAGLRVARGAWVVVMDGDLQHPPEMVPELVAAGVRDGTDFVVATRYRDGGDTGGLSSATRHWVSAESTNAARLAFPHRLHDCSDPMSGFFAVRAGAVDPGALAPHGFKILLEILARQPHPRISEVPFTFAERLSGTSKASLREGFVFMRRLAALRWAAWRTPWLARTAVMTGFGLVGVSGILVNSVALWAFADLLGIPLLWAATLATQVSTTWNFVLTDRWVFTGAKQRSGWQRFLGFAAINNLVLLARLPLLALLVHLHMGYLWANLLTLVAAFAVRFALSDRLLFTRREPTMNHHRDSRVANPPQQEATLTSSSQAAATDTSPKHRTGPVDLLIDLRPDAVVHVTRRDGTLPWRYNIHGLVRIASVVRLSELDAFNEEPDAAGAEPGPVDIEIRRGVVGNGRPRGRTRVTQYAGVSAVSYQEHLGRFGSDFYIDMRGTDDNAHPDATVAPIQVTVGPMLVHSPHVLYVNVVEALLRFVLVSHGYMLLHSACLDIDGTGVMLSALTDTGKTGTILRLVRETSARFLSDDMTVLGPDGVALDYPKQLTISQHTLRAVQAGDLSRREWRRLRVQSRLHSQEGRAVGARMGEMNLPIMTCNALTQFIVPPPKYEVERLVPCPHAQSVRVSDLFIIARGDACTEDLTDREALIDELIANTDDAYGFPPFKYFAPTLVINGMGYEELRAAERLILVSAMQHVVARRLVTPDFSWADIIPTMVAGSHPTAVGTPDIAGARVATPSERAAQQPAPTPATAARAAAHAPIAPATQAVRR